MSETINPYTPELAVQENIQRIRQAKQEGPNNVAGSTSQMIMFALALCDRGFFLPDNYRNDAPEVWWRRLDDVQREAVISWWRD